MALKRSVSVIGSADTAFCDRQFVIGLKNPDRSTPNICARCLAHMCWYTEKYIACAEYKNLNSYMGIFVSLLEL